jgi:hypothetical protein
MRSQHRRGCLEGMMMQGDPNPNPNPILPPARTDPLLLLHLMPSRRPCADAECKRRVRADSAAWTPPVCANLVWSLAMLNRMEREVVCVCVCVCVCAINREACMHHLNN